MSKYPSNLFRDDEAKAMIAHFYSVQRLAHINSLIVNEKEVPLSVVLGKSKDKISATNFRRQNVVSIGGKEANEKPSDLDLFDRFSFDSIPKTTAMTLQEIFIQEKGSEALRKMKINLQIA